MSETSPAEELRAAAKAMRERAEPCDAGPWIVVPDAPGALTLVKGADWSICRAHDGEAAHIASWPPVVALAVADWLDSTAGFLEDRVTIWGDQYALAVARAYLGTGTATGETR